MPLARDSHNRAARDLFGIALLGIPNHHHTDPMITTIPIRIIIIVFFGAENRTMLGDNAKRPALRGPAMRGGGVQPLPLVIGDKWK